MTPEQLAEMQPLIRRAISDPGSILPRADAESVSNWGMRAVLAAIEAHPVLEIRPYYPTQDAYDATCKALERHRQRADNAEAEVKQLKADNELLVQMRHGSSVLARNAETEVERLTAKVNELEYRIDGARGIHAPDEGGYCKVCVYSWGDEETERHPCPTDRVLNSGGAR